MRAAQACRSCSKPVYWLKHVTTDKPAPIDTEPSALGNITIDLEAGTYAIVPERERAQRTDLRTNHFMTCPQAKTWHRKGV